MVKMVIQLQLLVQKRMQLVTQSSTSVMVKCNRTKGQNGTSVTIQNIAKQPNGDTVVTFSDGKSITIPKGDKGDAGVKGADGHSITITGNTQEANGDRKLTFSDNTTVVIPKGDKGDKGDNGQNGTSVSITTIDTDSTGNKVVHFSDGKTLTVPKGQDGTSIGIKSITTSANGDKVVTFTDNQVLTIPKGEKVTEATMVMMAKTDVMVRQSQLLAQKQMLQVTQLSISVMVKCNRTKRPKRNISDNTKYR